MPTAFIAVQCYQCSTMQVKQQKKSSNKWSCVICNEKQSVRQIFARGFMAKEVRKFVQSFNMARQFSEERLSTTLPEIDHQPMNDNKKKRTDWSEYIAPEDDQINEIENDDEEFEGDELEAKVVTELPKELFKKPRLSNYCGSSGGGDGTTGGGFRPVFGKRKNKMQSSSQGQSGELNEYHSTRPREACGKLREKYLFRGKESACFGPTGGAGGASSKGDDGDGDCEPVKHKLSRSISKGASKWKDYLEEEDEDDDDGRSLGHNGNGRVRDFTRSHSRERSSDAFELVSEDQTVEEDIHPDFF